MGEVEMWSNFFYIFKAFPMNESVILLQWIIEQKKDDLHLLSSNVHFNGQRHQCFQYYIYILLVLRDHFFAIKCKMRCIVL